MTTTSQPLVSVVVPAHNEAKFLAECIDSIRAQTYSNWECLIVDNCSTDDTAGIAGRYAALDPRIRLLQNTALVRAVPNFNGGLRRISTDSKYCKIVFGDDMIFPECLERMVALAEEHASIGIVGAYGLQGSDVMWSGLPYPSSVVSGVEMCRKLFLDGLYVFGTGTSVLFRSEIVRGRDPFYNESNLHCDSEACCDILRTWDFGFVHQVLTFTRVRAGSLFQFSRERNTFIAGRLYDLVTYGPDCLNPSEFRTCLNNKLREYYSFLAAHVIRPYDAAFWEYHRNKLLEAGVGFDRWRLAVSVLKKTVATIVSPSGTIKRYVERRRLISSRPCSQRDTVSASLGRAGAGLRSS